MLTKTIIEMLKSCAKENLPKSGDAQNVMDQMYWCYMECKQTDNDKIKACYAALRENVELPLWEYDEVLYIVSNLCTEHGRLAFMEGLKIGLLLMQEVETKH